MKNKLRLSILFMFLLFIVSCTTTTPKTVQYTVSYETNGGTIINSETVNEGDYIPYPDEPTKEGFEFLGWYLDEEFETPVDFNVEVTEDITIYVQWHDNSIIVERTITYVLNGGTNSESNPTTFNKTNLPLQLEDATLEGKHFVGWFIDGIKVLAIPNSKAYDKDLTIEARFEDIFKITYSGLASDTVENPTTYYPSSGNISLNIPEMPGYTFLGWELNGKLVTYIPEDTMGNILLKTVYNALEYNITYELNGGENSSLNPKVYTREDGNLKLKAPSKDGYVFVGWELDGKIITTLDTSIIKDVTLYAIWEVEPVYHDIIYFLNGGQVNGSYTTKYQEGVGLALPTVSKTGYTFLGWNTENKEAATYIQNIPATATSDYTLYAIFKKNIVISDINYELYNGSFEGAYPTSYEEGTYVELVSPVRDGYDFLGWYLNAQYTGSVVTAITESMKGDIVLHAKWESNIPTYTVTYNLNGGAFVKENPYPTKADLVNAFLNDLNSYYGTSMDVNSFFDISYNVGALNVFFNDPTYNAKWAWIKTYFVATAKEVGYNGTPYLENEADTYFNTYLRSNIHAFINDMYRSAWPASMDFSNTTIANGYVNYLPGEADDIIYEFTADTETFTLPNVTRHEFTFIGWFDENGNQVTEITKGTNHNVILNARFESIYDVYTITYVTNGGTLPSDTIFEFTENDLLILNKASKPGYRFVGWYTSSDFSSIIVTDIPTGTKEDITLYAKYEALNYNIVYHTDGGTHENITTYNMDMGDIILSDATRQGYRFLGWYTAAGVKVEMIEAGTIGKVELYARYDAIVDDSIKYTVTFINELGEVIRTEEVSHGAHASEILLDTCEGLPLAWYNGGDIYNFEEKLTSDLTLHARWRVIDDVYNTIFDDKLVKDNVTMHRDFDTDMGRMSIVWSTSNPAAINAASGLVTLDYEEKEVTVTGTFKLGSTRFTVTRTYVVDKLCFRDLTTGPKPVFAYLYSNVASMQTPEVVLDTVDVINYGFARVTSDGLVDITELRYLSKVTELRKQGIRVLLCIGGYGTACKEFSDAALTAEGRSKFAASILSIIQEYHLDGVDIDWEYPGYQTGRDVTVDRPNFTLLMQEIQRQLKAANPEYLVTAALPGGKYGYTRYEIKKLNNILDYFHLMTYDLQDTGRATHHTGLYNGSYTPHGSAEQTVNTFVQQGASRNKLIVGVAFYGRKFNVTSSGSGIGYDNNLSTAEAITYTNIYNNYLVKIKNGSTTITRYWDDKTKAPYIYDKSTRIWITYDDPESIGYKCDYVVEQNLGGVMFWDYGEDQTFQLIQAIYDSLRQ